MAFATMDDVTKLWFHRAVAAASDTTRSALGKDNLYAQAFLNGFKAAVATQNIPEQVREPTSTSTTHPSSSTSGLIVLVCTIVLAGAIIKQKLTIAFHQWQQRHVPKRKRQAMASRTVTAIEDQKVRAERWRRRVRQVELVMKQEAWGTAKKKFSLDEANAAKMMRQRRITEFVERSKREPGVVIRRPVLWSETLQQSKRKSMDLDVNNKLEAEDRAANLGNHEKDGEAESSFVMIEALPLL